ncbi:hypothetical protein CLOSYM_02489 [[Clostridium] symbiosum ATCC 14940]|uniref:Uncharacterized protein n=1 Tax=[Clostridium] symbiosum ATCC 14940 TaxID=411472 RepID=A0ABC9TXG4_CLOSY|nr:hypothetical protein CLOSYM_02489 [[Clostridium] symbiosum ATCC 14940]
MQFCSLSHKKRSFIPFFQYRGKKYNLQFIISYKYITIILYIIVKYDKSRYNE